MAHVVVIGAGPAGCAAAAGLAERGHAVTLCEMGVTPVATVRWPLIGDATRSAYVGGVGLGGSSGINGSVLGAAEEPIPTGIASYVASPGDVGVALSAVSRASPLRLLGHDGQRLGIFDALGLASRASIDVRSSCRVESIVHDDSTLVVQTSAEELVADSVVVAAGPIGTPVVLANSELGLGTDRAASLGTGLGDHRCLTVTFVPSATGTPPGTRSEEGDLDGRASASVVAEIDGGALVAVDTFGDGSGLGGVLVLSDTPSRDGRVFRSGLTGAVSVDLGPIDPVPLVELWTAARPILERMAVDWSGEVVIDEWGTPLGRLGSDHDRVVAWIRRSVGGAFHAVGTSSSILDPVGRVLGVRGLLVAGAAALTRPPRWPMAACITSGQRAAAVIADDLDNRS